MDSSDLTPLVDDLRGSIDDLENALAPLLLRNHSEITSKLPLLDKAKISVLTTYAIESILFSVLKLNGVNAKEHPIFTELTRVKQYFEKIKEAESGSAAASRKRLNVDAPAAKRFIQAALAGNDQQVGGRQQVKKRKAEQVEPEITTPRTKSQQNGTPLKQSQDAQDVTASSTSKANGVTSAAEQNDDDKGEDKEKKKKKKKKNKREKDGPTDDQTRKHKKRKSDKPPKDSKTIFDEFVNRADKAKG